MPAERGKNIYDLKKEKEIILAHINKPISTEVNLNGKSFQTFTAAFIFPKGFMDKPENKDKVANAFTELTKQRREFNHTLDVLSLYAAAYKEHKMLAENGYATKSEVKVSFNNLLLYEDAMLKQGITKEMMKEAVTNINFHETLFETYADKVDKTLKGFANETGATVYGMEDSIKTAFRQNTIGVKKFDPSLPKLTDEEKRLYSTFSSNTKMSYFGGMSTANTNYKIDIGENYYCYEKKDGEYREKQYPLGFFSKISFFFTKLFYGGKEKKEIEANREAAKQEIEAMPEGFNDKKLCVEQSEENSTEVFAELNENFKNIVKEDSNEKAEENEFEFVFSNEKEKQAFNEQSKDVIE